MPDVNLVNGHTADSRPWLHINNTLPRRSQSTLDHNRRDQLYSGNEIDIRSQLIGLSSYPDFSFFSHVSQIEQ